MKKGQLRDRVLAVLASDEATRNNDTLLTVRIWKRYYPDKIKTVERSAGENKWSEDWVRTSDVLLLPREDHVKRYRAVIQNEENRYLPTDPAIRRKRKISEESWRQFLGYTN